jgi:hypothetical protein
VPNLEVYCTVHNCDYWGKHNHCLAEKILIVADVQAAAWPEGVDAQVGSMLESTEVQSCVQTACKTFRPRYNNEGPIADQRSTHPQLTQQFPHHN